MSTRRPAPAPAPERAPAATPLLAFRTSQATPDIGVRYDGAYEGWNSVRIDVVYAPWSQVKAGNTQVAPEMVSDLLRKGTAGPDATDAGETKVLYMSVTGVANAAQRQQLAYTVAVTTQKTVEDALVVARYGEEARANALGRSDREFNYGCSQGRSQTQVAWWGNSDAGKLSINFPGATKDDGTYEEMNAAEMTSIIVGQFKPTASSKFVQITPLAGPFAGQQRDQGPVLYYLPVVQASPGADGNTHQSIQLLRQNAA